MVTWNKKKFDAKGRPRRNEFLILIPWHNQKCSGDDSRDGQGGASAGNRGTRPVDAEKVYNKVETFDRGKRINFQNSDKIQIFWFGG